MVSPKRSNEVLPFGVALIFTALGGLGMAFFLGWIAVASWVTFAYRPAQALVVERHLHRHPGSKGGGYYQLQVLLEYRVAGEDYRSWVELPQSTRKSTGPEADAVL